MYLTILIPAALLRYLKIIVNKAKNVEQYNYNYVYRTL